LGGGRVEPFCECRQHHGDLVRGSFQPIQRSVASSTERDTAGLAAKGLDAPCTAMLAISDKGLDPIIGDAEVGALLIGTGEAFSGYPLRCSPPALHLRPGAYRSRRRLSTRGGSGGEETDRAILWGAWLEQTLEPGALGLAF